MDCLYIMKGRDPSSIVLEEAINHSYGIMQIDFKREPSINRTRESHRSIDHSRGSHRSIDRSQWIEPSKDSSTFVIISCLLVQKCTALLAISIVYWSVLLVRCYCYHRGNALANYCSQLPSTWLEQQVHSTQNQGQGLPSPARDFLLQHLRLREDDKGSINY